MRVERILTPVAQVSNLLYRRFPIGRLHDQLTRHPVERPAGWKPAIQQTWESMGVNLGDRDFRLSPEGGFMKIISISFQSIFPKFLSLSSSPMACVDG
jgi:hypothetical protein